MFPTPVPGIEMTLAILIPTAAVGLIIGKAGQFLKVRFASLEQCCGKVVCGLKLTLLISSPQPTVHWPYFRSDSPSAIFR